MCALEVFIYFCSYAIIKLNTALVLNREINKFWFFFICKNLKFSHLKLLFYRRTFNYTQRKEKLDLPTVKNNKIFFCRMILVRFHFLYRRRCLCKFRSCPQLQTHDHWAFFSGRNLQWCNFVKSHVKKFSSQKQKNGLNPMAAKIVRKELITFLPCQSALN